MSQIVATQLDGLFDGVVTSDLLTQLEDLPQVRFVVADLKYAVGWEVIGAEIDWAGGVMHVQAHPGALQQRDTLGFCQESFRPAGTVVRAVRERGRKAI